MKELLLTAFLPGRIRFASGPFARRSPGNESEHQTGLGTSMFYQKRVPIMKNGDMEIDEHRVITNFTEAQLLRRKLEDTRRFIAYGLLCLISLVLLLFLGAVAGKAITAADAKDLGAIFFGPLIGIFGTILGFYFSNKS
jgi:hypothetical protein